LCPAGIGAEESGGGAAGEAGDWQACTTGRKSKVDYQATEIEGVMGIIAHTNTLKKQQEITTWYSESPNATTYNVTVHSAR
jgi:hypothetical protein